jgi:hypothetical protein
MPFTQFTNLDFDQIKASIKDYLRANSNFTDFDFEGSNFSVLIDTLAYNTYITAFNSNMIVNESFLDSATLRENVVSLARTIGYVPRSRQSAKSTISFSVRVSEDTKSPTATLQPGLVCIGSIEESNYIFSIPEPITTSIINNVATFNNIEIYEGTFLTTQFVVNGSIDQRFILDNSFIDTSTLTLKVKIVGDTTSGREYFHAENILNIDKNSEIYFLQEIKDEKYELIFGDGIFGKKLENGSTINASYIVSSGPDGNGARNFSFSGSLRGSNSEIIIPVEPIFITTINPASNGANIESVNSVKYFAPRIYSSQNRAVTASDYEAIIKKIYDNTESVSIVGGEELDPPQFGNVIISIKPKNGDFISDFDKRQILSKLKEYTLAGIKQTLMDIKILFVEIESSIYYNPSKISNSNNLRNRVISSLDLYSKSADLNKFGGRFKYSKFIQLIDNVDAAITSNITKIIIRRNLKALINQFAQYEICFGNQFHINPAGFNIKSTGFKISDDPDFVYFTDVPNKNPNGTLDGSGKGILSVVKSIQENDQIRVISKSVGVIDYITGEININTINIQSTEKENNIIEIQAFPESNDIIGLKDLYLKLDISTSENKINMVKDTISSGEKISGVGYNITSSYSNGALTRK